MIKKVLKIRDIFSLFVQLNFLISLIKIKIHAEQDVKWEIKLFEWNVFVYLGNLSLVELFDTNQKNSYKIHIN